MKDRIWLSPPHMGQNEILYVKETFEDNWIAPAGPNLTNFEDSITNFSGAKYAAVVNSGTSAIHLALIALGVQAGDEVLCSTFTFIASANPIAYLKAIPVFIDSEPASWNMDPEMLKEAIEDRLQKGKKPKAILVVHAYGNAARMDEIISLSQKYEIPVIEDAAQAFGSTYKKKRLGTLGRVGIYSFNGNKIITTSTGGALVTDEKEIAESVRWLGNQAKKADGDFEHDAVGYNYQMSNILAGIGLGQMKIIYERMKQRKQVFEYYTQAFTDVPLISFSPETPESSSNRWLTCILIDTEALGVFPEEIKKALAGENIESRTLFKPLHQQQAFKACDYYGDRYSEKLYRQGLSLPSGSALKTSEMDRVIEVIRKRIGV